MRAAGREALARYAERLLRENLAERSRALYLTTARAFLVATGRAPARLRPEDVARYLARRASELGPAAHVGEAARLRRFLRTLPASQGERLAAAVPEVRATRRERRVLSEAEVARLLVAAGAEPRGAANAVFRACRQRDRACLELLYGLGLRASEACAIRLVDLDLAGAALLVRRGKRGESRALPLPAAALPALHLYLTTARGVLAGRAPAGATCDRLLLSRYGRPLRRGDVLTLVRAAGDRAGVRAHPHELRRALATHLAARGASLEAVRQLLGHQRLATTALYVGTSLADLHQAVARLDRLRQRVEEG